MVTLWGVIQGYLGLRAVSRARSVDFYADLDPDSPGHQRLLAAESSLASRPLVDDKDCRYWLARTGPGRQPGPSFPPSVPVLHVTSGVGYRNLTRGC